MWSKVTRNLFFNTYLKNSSEPVFPSPAMAGLLGRSGSPARAFFFGGMVTKMAGVSSGLLVSITVV